MTNRIDQLAILTLTAGSDLIEEVCRVEEQECAKIKSIRLIRTDPMVMILLKYKNGSNDLFTFCVENLFIDCEIVTSAVVDNSTTLLVEYSGGLMK